MLDRFAPLAFVLIWSSSFIGTRAGLRHMSPLLFVAVRMALCACVLLAVMVLQRRSWRVLARSWPHCAVAGVLMQGMLLMTAHYAMTHVAAAPIALIQTLNPLLTAVLAWPLLGERLRPRQWLGLLLGTAGVVLVAGLAAMHSQSEFSGLMLTTAGVICLCAGTVYFGRFCRGVPPLEGTMVQFMACAAVCSVAVPLFERPYIDGSAVALACIGWNAIVVSLGGMALYFLMLRRGSAAGASANFYLVPGTAGLMAWVLLGERLSPLAVAGLVVSSIGCRLVSKAPPGPSVAPRRAG
jgi:drug/metabolite transporter (DMT)-like permease